MKLTLKEKSLYPRITLQGATYIAYSNQHEVGILLVLTFPLSPGSYPLSTTDYVISKKVNSNLFGCGQ